MPGKIKCKNPVPEGMYGRDEFDDIHWYCENCGVEVIEAKGTGEKKFQWYHGRLATTPVFYDEPQKD